MSKQVVQISIPVTNCDGIRHHGRTYVAVDDLCAMLEIYEDTIRAEGYITPADLLRQIRQHARTWAKQAK